MILLLPFRCNVTVPNGGEPLAFDDKYNTIRKGEERGREGYEGEGRGIA
jgi:hypothetical protein